MTIEKAYSENHTNFRIEYEEVIEGTTPDQSSPLRGGGGVDQTTEFEIRFDHSAPAIGIDTGGRFVKHEIVGGPVVRQRVGAEPIEVSITGVCKEPTAKELDRLRTVDYGTIYSNRLPNESLDVHFVSTSTQPLSDGGAVELKDDDAEFLYTYDLECVEVVI